jgi:hypothetical protein
MMDDSSVPPSTGDGEGFDANAMLAPIVGELEAYLRRLSHGDDHRLDVLRKRLISILSTAERHAASQR